MKKILNDCGNEEISKEILSLWLDYEESRTVEAVLAHQLDKFEMIVQAGKEMTSSILLYYIVELHFLFFIHFVFYFIINLLLLSAVMLVLNIILLNLS
jgi:HD domain